VPCLGTLASGAKIGRQTCSIFSFSNTCIKFFTFFKNHSYYKQKKTKKEGYNYEFEKGNILCNVQFTVLFFTYVQNSHSVRSFNGTNAE
jgi:hypothetical protein